MTSAALLLSLAVATAAAARWPYRALSVLVVVIPLHSGLVLVSRNVVSVEQATVTVAAAWKEALLLGLVVGAAWTYWQRRPRLHAAQWLALGLVLLIAVRIPIDIQRGGSVASIVAAARLLGEPLLLFLAVTLLAPGYAWMRQTALWALPVVFVCAGLAVIQPIVGAGWYDAVYHAPGGTLHHSYLVQLPSGPRLRAVGTFVAPNELGLGMVVLGAVFVAPLLVTPTRSRAVAAAGLGLCAAALLLSYSRSAWLGAAAGMAAMLFTGRHGFAAALAQRHLLPTRRQLAMAGAMSLLALLVVAGVTGAAGLVVDTMTGEEPSAAGRGASIAAGIEAAVSYPTGLGLGSAGPRALDFEPRAMLTENWYLLYAIQLGWLPALLLLAFVGAILAALAGSVNHWLGSERRGHLSAPDRLRFYPGAVSAGVFVAAVAAFVGAMFIPAIMDLTSALVLSAAIGLVVSARWGEARAQERTSAPLAVTPHFRRMRLILAGVAVWSLIALVSAPWRPAVTGPAVTAQKGDTGSPDGFPENTLEAMVAAARKGADAVEIDVQRSAQGTWFALLMPRLDRTTTASGFITERGDATIQRAVIDGGIGYDRIRHGHRLRVPRLADIFAALSGYPVRVHLDVKELSTAAHSALAEFVLERGWAERTTINCKSVAAAAAVKRVSPRIATSAYSEHVPGASHPHASVDVWVAEHGEVGSEPEARSPREIVVFVHLEDLGIDETEVVEQARRLGAYGVMTNQLDDVLSSLGRPSDTRSDAVGWFDP